MSDYNEIKLQMMKLWKDTFHDTDEYIKLVFDNYFNPELVEYKVEDGEVVAAMLGVPYYFSMKSDKVDNQENGKLKGLYLCGLATKPACRKRGLMSEMIERINQRAYQLDFDFLFLIPANDGLKKYYFDRGFVEAFYRLKENYLPCHNFENEYYQRLMKSEDIGITDINYRIDYFNNLKADVLNLCNAKEVENIVEYIKSTEENNPLLLIRHSAKDIKIAIDECLISDGEVMFLINDKYEVVAVAFIDFETDEEIQDLIKKYDNQKRANDNRTPNDNRKGSADYNQSRTEKVSEGGTHYTENDACDIKDDIEINYQSAAKYISGTDENGICSSGNIVLSHQELKFKDIESSNILTSGSPRAEEAEISTSPNIKSVNIKAIFYNSECEKYRLLEAVARRFCSAERVTVVDTAMHNDNPAVWRPMFIGEKSMASPIGVTDNMDVPFNSLENAESHGMIRLLNPRKILKFLCGSSETFKNSILAVDSILQNEIKITTKEGNYLVNLPFISENVAKTEHVEEIHDCKNRGELPSENCKSGGNRGSNDFLTIMERDSDVNGVSELGIFPIKHQELPDDLQPVHISLQQLAEMLFSASHEQKIVHDSLGIPLQQTFITLMLD